MNNLLSPQNAFVGINKIKLFKGISANYFLMYAHENIIIQHTVRENSIGIDPISRKLLQYVDEVLSTSIDIEVAYLSYFLPEADLEVWNAINIRFL